jgi:beta-galactosidase
MLGSENPSVGGIRGKYKEKSFFGSYETMSLHHEALWRYTVSHDFVAGDYLWTGIDYLGESRWPYRGAGCGPLDTAGFRKDSFYYFRSIWNDKETTLHLLPHWNWQGDEGEFKQVVCYTNCDEVRLYCNGRFVGTRGYACPRQGANKAWNDRPKVHPTTNDLHLSWDVPYEPGVLRAEGYRNGELVEVAIVETTKEPVRLVAKPDKTKLLPLELVQIELATEDVDGRFVPDAAVNVKCHVEGPAHLIGMDGGDLTDLSLYANPQRKMFSGLLLAVLQADETGEVKVTFQTEGMPEVSVVLMVEYEEEKGWH